jgi:NADH-quinone oxidoreductase subunit H
LDPNRVGFRGLLQPVADGIKLFFKEDIIPTNVDKTLYIMAPAIALAPVLMSVAVLPWNGSPEWGAVAPALNIGILFLLAIASIEVYGVILAGWASNNKYSLLGGLRASSQVISYELGMGFSVIAVLLMSGTLMTQQIVMGTGSNAFNPGSLFEGGQGLVQVKQIGNTNFTVFEHLSSSGFWNWNVLRLFPFGLIAAFVYLVSMVAETNRAPFDLPEAETELVAGFHTEYSSMKFAMFFMGEYANMMIVSAIAITLFFGGWLAPWGPLGQIPASAGAYLPAWLINTINMAVLAPLWFGLKLFALICFFILLRASYPRLRYDMLMKFGWKGILPVALANVSLIALSLALQQQLNNRLAGHLIAGCHRRGVPVRAVPAQGAHLSWPPQGRRRVRYDRHCADSPRTGSRVCARRAATRSVRLKTN